MNSKGAYFVQDCKLQPAALTYHMDPLFDVSQLAAIDRPIDLSISEPRT